MRHALILTPAVTLALLLGGCSSDPASTNAAPEATNVAGGNMMENAATPAGAAPHNAANAAAPASSKVIGLEGLGDLRIGQAVPKDSRWAERGAQTGDACRTVSSPDYPGVYAIVTEGKVRRITVGQRSDVKLAEGIGVGDTEKDVEKWFAGFRAEPHKYEEAPAKYLTAPNAARGDSALRFEIGHDGKVSMIHIGTMPVLAYVEGCA